MLTTLDYMGNCYFYVSNLINEVLIIEPYCVKKMRKKLKIESLNIVIFFSKYLREKIDILKPDFELYC